MLENRLGSLYKERSRLLDTWRNANTGDKMSIIIRIDDINEQIATLKKNVPSDFQKNGTKLNPEY